MIIYNIINTLLLTLLGYKISKDVETLLIGLQPGLRLIEVWSNKKNPVNKALRLNHNLHKTSIKFNIVQEILSIGSIIALLIMLNHVFAINNEYNQILITTVSLLALTISFLVTAQQHFKGDILIRYYYVNTLTLQKYINKSNEDTTKTLIESVDQLAQKLNMIIEAEQGCEVIDSIKSASERIWGKSQNCNEQQ